MDPLAIAAQFRIVGEPNAAEVHRGGHINDTFFVDTDGRRRYVLQRINGHVFPDPWVVVRNAARVIGHVSARAPGLVPALIPARDGAPGVEVSGGVWRMLAFIANGEVGTTPLELDAALVAGRAFGAFQAALSDFDLAGYRQPIAGFLELTPCFERLDSVLGTGEAARRDAAKDVIAALLARRDAVALGARGPLGLIHADCKISNVLFERGSTSLLAVLDLDTVMVGRRAWDFGDLVRSAAARGAEDAPGLALDLGLFDALAKGFANGLGDLFDRELRDAWLSAPRYITLTLAVRFLVDFLDGDRWFRVDDPTHNLRRARAQLALVESQERHARDMERILEGL